MALVPYNAAQGGTMVPHHGGGGYSAGSAQQMNAITYDPRHEVTDNQTLSGYYTPIMLEHIRSALTSLLGVQGQLHVDCYYLDDNQWIYAEGRISLHTPSSILFQPTRDGQVQANLPPVHNWPVPGVMYANISTHPNIMVRVRDLLVQSFASIQALGASVAQGLTHLGQQAVAAQQRLQSSVTSLGMQAADHIQQTSHQAAQIVQTMAGDHQAQSAQIGHQVGQQLGHDTLSSVQLQTANMGRQVHLLGQEAISSVQAQADRMGRQANQHFQQLGQEAISSVQAQADRMRGQVGQHFQQLGDTIAQQSATSVQTLATQATLTVQSLISDAQNDLTSRRRQLDRDNEDYRSKVAALQEQHRNDLVALAMSEQETEDKKKKVEELAATVQQERSKLDQENKLIEERTRDLALKEAELSRRMTLLAASAPTPPLPPPVRLPTSSAFQGNYQGFIPPPPIPQRGVVHSSGSGSRGPPSVSTTHIDPNQNKVILDLQAEVAQLRKLSALSRQQHHGDDDSSSHDEGGHATDEEDESSCAAALVANASRERVLSLEQRFGEPFSALTLSRSTLGGGRLEALSPSLPGCVGREDGASR